MRTGVSITQTAQEVLGLSLLELLQIKVCSDSLLSASSHLFLLSGMFCWCSLLPTKAPSSQLWCPKLVNLHK